MEKIKNIILRRRTNDPEKDRYEFFLSYKNGVELTTPFKLRATVFKENDKIEVLSKDWKPVQVTV